MPRSAPLCCVRSDAPELSTCRNPLKCLSGTARRVLPIFCRPYSRASLCRPAIVLHGSGVLSSNKKPKHGMQGVRILSSFFGGIICDGMAFPPGRQLNTKSNLLGTSAAVAVAFVWRPPRRPHQPQCSCHSFIAPPNVAPPPLASPACLPRPTPLVSPAFADQILFPQNGKTAGRARAPGALVWGLVALELKYQHLTLNTVPALGHRMAIVRPPPGQSIVLGAGAPVEGQGLGA